jgi:hypothetical protein
MSIARGRHPLVVAAVALLMVSFLSGCSGNPVESLIKQATGGTVDVGGKSVPADFPAEVPLALGEVVSGARVGTAAHKVWNVSVTVSGANAMSAIVTQFTTAGFTQSATVPHVPGVPAGEATAAFSNGKFGVLVVVAPTGNDGYVANYTVTPVDK